MVHHHLSLAMDRIKVTASHQVMDNLPKEVTVVHHQEVAAMDLRHLRTVTVAVDTMNQNMEEDITRDPLGVSMMTVILRRPETDTATDMVDLQQTDTARWITEINADVVP
jgi:hypothetical protein